MSMSEIAKAYIREYGHAPENRDEQDRYSAFRFGWEAGVRYGEQQERIRLRNAIDNEIEEHN